MTHVICTILYNAFTLYDIVVHFATLYVINVHQYYTSKIMCSIPTYTTHIMYILSILCVLRT